MRRSEFYFSLPSNLIAQKPSGVRGEDRLLVLKKDGSSLIDDVFSSIPNLLPDGALLVFNNSKVRQARVYGSPISNPKRKIEFLFVDNIDEKKCIWEVLSPKMKQLRVGEVLVFGSDIMAKIIRKEESKKKLLHFVHPIDESFFETLGHIPLPPYIRRDDDVNDKERYQTIYASPMGSIAAPTAGLHFTDEIIKRIKEKGIEILYLTLHVGLGTFLPVRAEKIEEHNMHKEEFFIEDVVAKKINDAKKMGRAIVACGTTTVRSLEASYNPQNKAIESGRRSTDIFIYPPYHFNVVDALITNFHTPESTLLMLVSAFAGKELIMRAYEHAIRKEYKFFSYGDAMLII